MCIRDSPKRAASGFDVNRLQLIIAVLTNKLKINLQNQDIYINVVGGLQLKDPGVDVAVACAIFSALKNKVIKKTFCLIGEIGLSGELRLVSYQEKRYSEAKRLGYIDRIEGKDLQIVLNKLLGD
jgi:DNA repair protein RadA/Sms